MVRPKQGRKRSSVREESSYEVERIIGVKFVGNKKEYQIKWKDYPNPTWQTLAPYECVNLIREFEGRLFPLQNSSSAKKASRSDSTEPQNKIRKISSDHPNENNSEQFSSTVPKKSASPLKFEKESSNGQENTSSSGTEDIEIIFDTRVPMSMEDIPDKNMDSDDDVIIVDDNLFEKEIPCVKSSIHQKSNSNKPTISQLKEKFDVRIAIENENKILPKIHEEDPLIGQEAQKETSEIENEIKSLMENMLETLTDNHLQL